MQRRLSERLGSSLVTRLLLAQMLLAVLLWVAVIAYLMWDTAHNDPVLHPRHVAPRADLILTVVDSLATHPERLQDALARIDAFQRRENHEDDSPALRLTMNVWDGQRLLYASPGEPGVLPTSKRRELERVQIDGKTWRTYTQQSERSDARVTLARSEQTVSILLALGSHGILALPLVISLPFLFLPAWVSVRIALRPWRRFSDEIEQRSPTDLAPVQFGSRYRELQPLSIAVNRLLERVRASLSRERSFIADAAHELRTPLAAMRVNVEALQAHRTDARDTELLDGLLRSGERANRLVSQLLGLMRTDSIGSASPAQALPLEALLQDRLAALSGLASQHDVELVLTVRDDCLLQAERESLTSLVDNLLDNAIKHSPPGATVDVRAECVDHAVLLSVEDAGPGIPHALRKRVFDRFYRAPDQMLSGSGLGLAIVKAVADRMCASIELRDGEGGRGLRVVLRFPQPAAAARATPGP